MVKWCTLSGGVILLAAAAIGEVQSMTVLSSFDSVPG